MNDVLDFAGPIYRASIDLAENIPLHVHLVRGENYAVWIDSGIKSMFPLFQETMAQAGVTDSDLRFILHTHSHHDHIGANAQLKDKTGCLIAAHSHYAVWHADFEQHYQEFARPFPHLVSDTPELREEVLAILDEPRPLDLFIDEGVQFNLGGGVNLQAISFPGHLLAEFGWFEASTHTLILGDAVTGLEWPLFHSHLSVPGYRDSLVRIKQVIAALDVAQVLFAHFPPMRADEVDPLLAQAEAYIDEIEATIIRLLASQNTVSLELLWVETCRRMERMQEFRALNMVFAHLQDLQSRNFIREVEPEIYQLR
jgi:glyoxylase-like metal-dependent hydrolase (beta-lactamase superfamily II)